MTAADRDEFRRWAEEFSPVGLLQARQALDVLADLKAAEDVLAVADATIARLRVELEGERKANALLAAGMESQSALQDGLKQENRRLAAEKDALLREIRDSNDREVPADRVVMFADRFGCLWQYGPRGEPVPVTDLGSLYLLLPDGKTRDFAVERAAATAPQAPDGTHR